MRRCQPRCSLPRSTQGSVRAAKPILRTSCFQRCVSPSADTWERSHLQKRPWRSEEHTSELQSRLHLVCRLLLEKKKKIIEFLVNLPLTASSDPNSTVRKRVAQDHTNHVVR